MNATIQCSKNYDDFRFELGNRPLDPLKRKKMKASMQANGFLPSFPIIVNDEGIIRDGQHRFDVAKELHLAIYYVVDNDLTLRVVQEISTIPTGWSAEDYLKSYANLGDDNYLRLRNLVQESGLSLTSVLSMIGFQQNVGARNTLASGKFEFTSQMESQARFILNILQDFAKINPSAVRYSCFIRAMVSVLALPEYDHERMKARLTHQSTKLVRCTTIRQVLAMLSEIYNHGTQASHRIRFEDRIPSK